MALLRSLWKKIDFISPFDSDATRYVLLYNYIIFFALIIFTLTVYSNHLRIAHTVFSGILHIVDSMHERTLTPEDYCTIIGCEYIEGPNDVYNISSDLTSVKLIENELAFIDKTLYAGITFKGYTYYVSTANTLLYVGITALEIYFVLFLVSVILVQLILRKERTEFMEAFNAKDAELQYSILANVVANINHNLKSPLLVVTSVIDELKFIKPDPRFMDNYNILLGMGDEALEHISDLIIQLSDYTSPKHDTEEKSIYELCDIAFSMVRRTSIHNFKRTYIDPRLKWYSVYKDNGMTNGLFLNILMNHIRNSLEAHGNVVHVNLDFMDDKHIVLHIVDNGDGVHDDVKEKLYKETVTSKAIGQYDRGVGMYLNKYILTHRYEGDDYLVETTPGIGSTFAIKIRYMQYDGYHNSEE